jgi:hypothetical protein
LKVIQAAGVKVLLRVKFQTFRRALDDHYSVVMLVAHHAEGGVEFSDAIYPWLRVREVVTERYSRGSLALVFVVCDSESWKRELTTLRRGPGELAGAAWEVPPLGSLQFVRLWLSELDGQRTLPEAQDRAVRRWWGGVKP